MAHAVNSTLYFGMGSACETGGLDTSLFFSFLDFTSQILDTNRFGILEKNPGKIF